MAAKTISVEQRFELFSKLGANTKWDALDPSVVQALIDSPHNAGLQFTKFLCNGGRVTYELKAFPTWKTIKLGMGPKTGNDFKKAIKAAGMKIGDWANDIIGKPAFKAGDTEQEVDLVNMSVAELGFKGSATYKQICDKAIELGLELCPAEVGPQLRLQYTDQPMNEWVVVVMEAITDSGGDLDVFSVERDDDGTWLLGNDGRPDQVWRDNFRFVFVRRK